MKKLCILLLITFLVLPAAGECRRFNGKFNNLKNPLWGSAGIRFNRLTPSDYGNPNTIDQNSISGTSQNESTENIEGNEPNENEITESPVTASETNSVTATTTDSNFTGGQSVNDTNFTGGRSTNDSNFTGGLSVNDTNFTGGRSTNDSNFTGGLSVNDANFTGGRSQTVNTANQNLTRPNTISSMIFNPIDFNTIDFNAIPAGSNRGSARQVSDLILDTNQSITDPCGRTDFIWAWAEFIDHDLEHVNAAQPSEPFNIPVPPNDPNFTPESFLPYLRSQFDPNSTPRQQINSTTSWLDASMIYGHNIVDNNSLRTFTGGRLKVSSSANGDLLPLNDTNTVSDANLFLSGDDRTNQMVTTIALQTLFVREHNRLCGLIEANEPNWSDDQIFQKARHIVSAEIQVITYKEFLPAFLRGGTQLSAYPGYEPNVNPAIAQEFAFGAFPIYLSGVSPQLAIRDANTDTNSPTDTNLPFAQALFNPQYVQTNGIDSILRGLSVQTQQRIDSLIISALRNNFNGNDLAAIKIQRGRDHGLESYNAMRSSLGFTPITSFSQLSTDPNVQANFQNMYQNVNNIDPWVGFLAEYNVTAADINDANITDNNNIIAAKLSRRIIRQQFERLRNADRFWYTIDPNLNTTDRAFITSLTLADVIQNNTAVTNLRSNVFFVNEPNEPNEPNEVTDIIKINSIRVIDNFFCFLSEPLILITGSSLDFKEANVMEGNSVDVIIFADSNNSPSVNESLPFSNFFSRNKNIVFRGSPPVVSFKIAPRAKTFQMLIDEPNLASAKTLTVDIGIGNFLGEGTGTVQNPPGFLNAFLAIMNESCTKISKAKN
jgi:hypothetical protein